MLRAAGLLFGGGLLGKLLGVAREVLLAGLFGTSAPVGALRMAQSTALLPVNFFTAEILSAGVVPLSATYTAIAEEQARRFRVVLYGLFSLVSVLLSVLLFLGAEWWVSLLAPGFDGTTKDLAVLFVRVLSAGIPFYLMGSLFAYLEMSYGGYTLISLRASIQSIGMIGGAVVAYWQGESMFLALGFTLAYGVYAGWGAVTLGRRGALKLPESVSWVETKEILGRLWLLLRPLLLVPVFVQGNIAVERAVASLLGVAVVAALDYAKFVAETGLILIAVPLGLAALPTMTRVPAEQVRNALERIVPGLLLMTVPISVFLFSHSHAVVEALYARGAFDGESVRLTAAILRGLAGGLWAQITFYVLLKVLNAQLRNSEVLLFMAGGLAANTLFNLTLYRHLGPMALGLGASLCATVQFFFAIRAFSQQRSAFRLLAWLTPGAVAYVLLSHLMPKEGVLGLAIGILASTVFWSVFLFAVPALRIPMLRIAHDVFERMH